MANLFITLITLIPIYLYFVTPVISTKKVENAEQFYVSSGSLDDSCFVIEALAIISVNYKDKSNKVHVATVYVNSTLFSEKSLKVNGSCYMENETMIVSWDAMNTTSYNWKLTMLVTKTDVKYRLARLTLSVPLNGTFVDISEDGVLDLEAEKVDYSVDLNTYYYCKNEMTLRLAGSNESTAQLVMSNVKWVSFRKSDKAVFSGPGTPCPLDALVNHIVPMVVGVVLAVMVLVVLVTFVIGRRRHHRSNYQTI